MRAKVNAKVRIKATGIEGKVIHKNGQTLHVQTVEGDIIKTLSSAVIVLGLVDKILAKIIQIFTFFKTPKNNV